MLHPRKEGLQLASDLSAFATAPDSTVDLFIKQFQARLIAIRDEFYRVGLNSLLIELIYACIGRSGWNHSTR
jgi:hypothetical protein